MLEFEIKKNDINEDFEGEETLNFSNDSNIEEEIYPYKNISIGRDNFSAYQLYRKYNNGIIKLDPEFQREGNVWNLKQKSELIESIIIGIPLPILYIKENVKGDWILIDGRQRLSTIFDFMDNKFALTNLTILKNYNGLKFKENNINSSNVLTIIDRGKIEDVQLVLHIIKEPTPEKLTYDLFDRVNRGGTRLNNQEMRNAIYQGSSTLYLKTLSKLEVYQKATSHISSTRMKDRYLILRFISFYLWRKKISKDSDSKYLNPIEYKSDLEDFLAKSMKFLNILKFEINIDNISHCQSMNIYNIKKNISSADNLYSKILDSFNTAMQRIYEMFGEDSFRLPRESGGIRRPINMALFEVIVYYFIELENEFDSKKHFIKEEYLNLISNKYFKESKDEEDDFVKSLTYTVDSNKSVIKRFKIIEKIINKIKKL